MHYYEPTPPPNHDHEVLKSVRLHLERTRDERTARIVSILDRLEESDTATRIAAGVVIRHAVDSTESDPLKWFDVPTNGHPRPTVVLPGILFAPTSLSDTHEDPIREALLATGEFYRYRDFRKASEHLGLENTRTATKSRPAASRVAINQLVFWQSARYADDEWRERFLTTQGTKIHSGVQTGMFLIHTDLVAEYLDDMIERWPRNSRSVAITAMVNGREELARAFLTR